MTNPTGTALFAHERVVEAVARAIHEKRMNPDNGQHWFHERAGRCGLSKQLARAAIEAYTKAMREGT